MVTSLLYGCGFDWSHVEGHQHWAADFLGRVGFRQALESVPVEEWLSRDRRGRGEGGGCACPTSMSFLSLLVGRWPLLAVVRHWTFHRSACG